MYKKIVAKLPEALDPLYSTVNQLKHVNRDNIMECTVLCTRSKIYTNGMEVIRLYKQRQFKSASFLTQRLIKQINIHRYQLYKIAKLGQNIDLSNLRYLQDLKILFTRLANLE
jgi:hypothetical protein